MNTTTDREHRVKRGDTLWTELRAELDAHPHGPLRVGLDWTGHDVYAHFARWTSHAATCVRAILACERPPLFDEDEDALNERWKAEDRDFPTDVVRERCLSSREDLRSLALGFTDEQWEQFGEFSTQDINGSHYDHHLRAIHPERPE